MKKVYWRPRKVSRTGLVLIALISLAGLLVVEQFKGPRRRPHYDEKLAAAEKAREAFEVIKNARVDAGPPIDVKVDPSESGLIGEPMTQVTSVSGVLPAKQTSANPNFAAVIVDMLKQAGVNEGDVVALGLSGSFPALNACTFAAVETLGLEPISIASVSASQWGANVEALMWVDMEKKLVDAGVFEHRSIAASMGGYEDTGGGLSKEGKQAVLDVIQRNELELIDFDVFEENVAFRMEKYRKEAGGRPIRCYINVGGGATSVGKTIGKKLFEPGLNFRPPARIDQVVGVMPAFSLRGVPCIHMINVVQLAEQYGLEVAPQEAPQVGQAGVFEAIDYDPNLVVVVLCLVVLSLYAFIRTDIGFRLLRSSARSSSDGYPEPMV